MNKQGRKALNALFHHFKRRDNQVRIAQAPGRVNLIGGHTDYNGGFVLPVAINKTITVAAQARNDMICQAYSMDYNEKAVYSLDQIQYSSEKKWMNYLQGVSKELLRRGYHIQGMNFAIASDIPIGAGLSSSAALEVAIAIVFQLTHDLSLDKVEMAELCRQAENQFVGVNCGIMDQFTAVLGKKNHALFLDCTSKQYNRISVPRDVKIVIANTNVRHDLVDSVYNTRVEECRKAVQLFDAWLEEEVTTLRDISLSQFDEYQKELPDTIRKRVQHIIYENKRVRKAKKALKQDNIKHVGALMKQSHASLRDLYEVSCDELDQMIRIGLEVDGVLGARMTGAGFGGCTVNLVKDKAIPQFQEHVRKSYTEATGISPTIYVSTIANGVHELDLPQTTRQRE